MEKKELELKNVLCLCFSYTVLLSYHKDTAVNEICETNNTNSPRMASK